MEILSNANENEYIIKVTNTSTDTVNNVKLHFKPLSSNINKVTDLIEKLIIHRERGSFLLDKLDTDMLIGNLSPNESAKIQFKLKKSVKTMDIDSIFSNVELKSEKFMD
ncbi:hypothetical protein [Candidatus Epulonipiscium viviparus]|uniref:hypothetical protein n=1 Tax=Candidatus Epulonipiscium viviparus TaxID=420336 RepID=UPI00016C031D|nr:hypothetical protein [Candidatus Epulopiscium viviparus]